MRRIIITSALCLSLAAIHFLPAYDAYSQDPSSMVAQMQVRVSELEEQLRKIQGKVEQVEFENRRLREQIDLYQQDANIRFQELESNKQAAAAPSTDTTFTPKLGDDGMAPPPQAAKPAAAQFKDPREHYNHAFSLLNKTQYEEAGESFKSFIATYPSDPLIGNAYYWAGETFYVRQNYPQALELFRKGYEIKPEGPKAGDNLLKLGMTLGHMDRKSEACVVLKQVAAKFGETSSSLLRKSESERKRLACS